MKQSSVRLANLLAVLATAAAFALLTWSLAFALPPTARAAEKRIITVAADGSGNFTTVPEAIAAVPDLSRERTVVHVKAGTYADNVIVPKTKTNVTLEGEGAEKTILTWDKGAGDPAPVGGNKFNPGLYVEASDFQATGLTVQNTFGDKGQALAVRVDGDRAVFRDCRLLGWQDTLMVNKGRSLFRDCYVEGRVDFIYGDGAAVFERCAIHSKNGGYVTAASTPPDKPFGFVFLDCQLTGDPAPWVDPTGAVPPKKRVDPRGFAFLGRPWRPYGSVAFIRCEMGEHLKPEGWSNWGKPENEGTARYVEFGNTGPGATTAARVPWAKHLNKEAADRITVATVLGGSDHWLP